MFALDVRHDLSLSASTARSMLKFLPKLSFFEYCIVQA